jgi:hypothetical protein
LQTFQPPRINKKNPVSLAVVFSRPTLFPQLFSLFVTRNLDPGYRNPNNKLMLATFPTPPVIATHRPLQNAVKPLILKILPLNYLLSIFCENHDRSGRSNCFTVNSLRRVPQKIGCAHASSLRARPTHTVNQITSLFFPTPANATMKHRGIVESAFIFTRRECKVARGILATSMDQGLHYE